MAAGPRVTNESGRRPPPPRRPAPPAAARRAAHYVIIPNAVAAPPGITRGRTLRAHSPSRNFITYLVARGQRPYGGRCNGRLPADRCPRYLISRVLNAVGAGPRRLAGIA
ncbi:hypothetical protein EVAR_67744_1 [Eumeta japonica]|uniref:Uncharacterized protein n=1 Tax=Eumeta variegata TaxID=151549 RepID=A0A4C1ZG21_EUMVA|nr:hypothetical protein EVAR_67744_1 [Eumeta japonica]